MPNSVDGINIACYKTPDILWNSFLMAFWSTRILGVLWYNPICLRKKGISHTANTRKQVNGINNTKIHF